MAASPINKNLSKVKYCSKGFMSFQSGFCSPLNVCFDDMQKGGKIYQLVCGEFPFAATSSKKNRTEKILFVCIALAVRSFVNIFCSEFVDIHEKSQRGKKTNNKATGKR